MFRDVCQISHTSNWVMTLVERESTLHILELPHLSLWMNMVCMCIVQICFDGFILSLLSDQCHSMKFSDTFGIKLIKVDWQDYPTYWSGDEPCLTMRLLKRGAFKWTKNTWTELKYWILGEPCKQQNTETKLSTFVKTNFVFIYS